MTEKTWEILYKYVIWASLIAGGFWLGHYQAMKVVIVDEDNQAHNVVLAYSKAYQQCVEDIAHNNVAQTIPADKVKW